jgi:hypothetical protein
MDSGLPLPRPRRGAPDTRPPHRGEGRRRDRGSTWAVGCCSGTTTPTDSEFSPRATTARCRSSCPAGPGIIAKLAERGEPVDLRHQPVEHDGLEATRQRSAHSFGSVSRRDHFVAFVFKRDDDQGQDVSVILGDEQSSHLQPPDDLPLGHRRTACPPRTPRCIERVHPRYRRSGSDSGDSRSSQSGVRTASDRMHISPDASFSSVDDPNWCGQCRPVGGLPQRGVTGLRAPSATRARDHRRRVDAPWGR